MAQGNSNWIDILVNQEVDVTTSPMRSQIGDVMFFASGVFLGASVMLQLSPDDVMNTDLYATPDDAEWFDSAESIFTLKAMLNADLGEVWFRVIQSGSAEGTSITLKLRPRVEKVI